MESKASLLKTGNIVHYSQTFDLYFVTKITYYTYKGTKCNRVSYFTFSMGRHRRMENRVLRLKKDVFDKKLKWTKALDSKN